MNINFAEFVVAACIVFILGTILGRMLNSPDDAANLEAAKVQAEIHTTCEAAGLKTLHSTGGVPIACQVPDFK